MDDKVIWRFVAVTSSRVWKVFLRNFRFTKKASKKHISYWLYPSAYDPIKAIFFTKRSCYEEKCIYYRSFGKLFGFWCLFKLPNMGSRLGANWCWLSRCNTKKSVYCSHGSNLKNGASSKVLIIAQASACAIALRDWCFIHDLRNAW